MLNCGKAVLTGRGFKPILLMSNLISLALLIAYGAGIWKFWNGFDRTNFDRSFSNRLKLALLWPALIFNKPYRQNFTKALKASKR